ncbi:hypothetical protein FEP54_05090 [Burkholderia multivorans]|jgi:hypothetical protein|nr:hypothetical protein [Burkholderia multivorans]MDR8926351.1 hypothetical protein [Burkholderia multivorans]MDR8968834.1 hypothetical protein [Burkholderia multivorans]MDR8992840.1 hypothetical protein [Burkholderia multivorans]MDR9023870.1 hypothetical protein [Burkholderia multivorans]
MRRKIVLLLGVRVSFLLLALAKGMCHGRDVLVSRG